MIIHQIILQFVQAVLRRLFYFLMIVEKRPDFPIITGQDCDIASVKNILKGLQSMSIFKDTRILAARTVQMVNSILAGEEVEVNNAVNNNVFDTPTFYCTPLFADINNYVELLIDSGYYTAAELAQ